MRTNIDIDDELMESAMRAGPYTTKKDAVEAGLRLLARKVHYQEILKLRGKLQWDDGGDWSTSYETTAPAIPLSAEESRVRYATKTASKKAAAKSKKAAGKK